MQNTSDQTTIDFDSIKLSLASPELIAQWSHGEVTKPETINYRTQRPEKDGLFCEKIFGPTKDWQCYCGKYKGIRYRGIVCDKCGVLVTRSIVRRERMGHITLAVPVTHIWFLRGTPSSIGLVLNMGVRELERVTYFANYIITAVDDKKRATALKDLEADYKKRLDIAKKANTAGTPDEQAQALAEITAQFEAARAEIQNLAKYQLLPESNYRELNMKYGEVFTASIGAEAIYQLLCEIDLKKLTKELKLESENSIGQKQRKALKRLKTIEGMLAAGIRPEWMVMTSVPVIPPDLRPMVQLDGGRFAASDLNDLYRRVINRNNRLKKLYDLEAPEVICRNEKRMLQEAVDALFDNNARRERAVSAAASRKKLKSLTDLLKGKQGRFRQNLLGKRVDYSGRSVIVVGPHLKLDQCGIPKMMALELFKPFVIGKLIEKGMAHNVKSASRMIERARTEVWDTLDEVIADKYVLLNRAPTLHRLGIQAFKPILIEGKAIQLHPLVCHAFNADFDGDMMAVHVPLSTAAQTEAREIMLSSNNLLKPSSGEPVIFPSQEMVLGCYYLTWMRDGMRGENKAFATADEAEYAYRLGLIDLQAKIRVRLQKGELITTSAGRIIFNEILPDEMQFRNEAFTMSTLKKVMAEIFATYGKVETVRLADDIKQLGFRYATRSGISIGIDDLVEPPERQSIIDAAETRSLQYTGQYQQGLITEAERRDKTIETWSEATNDIEKALESTLDAETSTLAIDINSGARVKIGQANQMAGMKGLMLNAAGRTIELPVRSNYKEGLSVLEYFISTHGARKGLTDTALKTAESGYLTRRLVDVAQDIVISEPDCGDKEGYMLNRAEAEAVGEDTFASWVVGRVAAAVVTDPQTKTAIVKKGQLITDDQAKQIAASSVNQVRIRSVLSCKSTWGVCQACYGEDLAKSGLIELGEAVGIIAAQSIGEPGTQLTMKTFHSGGVAASEDITQGLPRVEEIFEARNPKGEAVLADVDGVIQLQEEDGRTRLRILPSNMKVTELPLEGFKATVKTGAVVSKGQVIAQAADPKSRKSIKSPADGTVKVSRDQIELTHEGTGAIEYTIAVYHTIVVKHGQLVTRGQRLTEGSVNLQDMLRLVGREAIERYIVDEVQAIYLSQGQTLAAKHIEIIVRQMFSRLRIVEPNDTNTVSGDIVSQMVLHDENEAALASGGKAATYEQLLLSITKISTSSDSWLSAASFQETTRVLIGAAMCGKQDRLRGLKENVIIGRLIPVGTGFRPEEEDA